MDLQNQIKKLCTEAGFHKAGFFYLEELISEGGNYTNWLKENRNAGMQWMEKNTDKRIFPAKMMEEAKSVISLAYIYDTPFEHSNEKNIAKISRYAWGEIDYHKFLKKKLKTLCGEIEKLEDGIKTKFYVDDGPVLEKALAVRAGIGWQGKNSNVIIPGTGSYFFLCEIFINKDFVTSERIEDMCGNCNICVAACPTGAIYENYKVDANLCISYHTIENREEIPEYINLDNWVFGCDVCQDVCPYNSHSIFTDEKSFYPLPQIFNKPFDELSKISEEEFNELFKSSPVKRTKFSGWKRNLNHSNNLPIMS